MNNPPAFPYQIDNGETIRGHTGMTLRDYMAAKAMQAMLSAYPCQGIDEGDGGLLADHEALANDSYDVADAMMKAREA